jgi:UDP-2,3-diacylglucosamine hydrolase
VTAVLGTDIHVLATPCERALLVSDLHIPADGGAVLAALGDAVAAARAARAPLFLLGDVFDTYVARGQVRVGVWREVAALLAGLAADGLPVHVLHGNRDFLLGAEFAAASRAVVVAGGLRARLGGVDTLLLHGDELCQNDLPYQRAKRWLRHPLTRAVARSLPVWLAVRIAARARRRSAMVIAAGDQRRFLPTAAAVDAAFATGVDRLVFGHIHRFSCGQRGRGGYRVLPAFDVDAVGVAIDAAGWRAVRFRPGGQTEPVADPGPCPLAE